MYQFLLQLSSFKINLPHIYTPAIQCHFTTIHSKGFINRIVTYASSEAGCNIMFSWDENYFLSSWRNSLVLNLLEAGRKFCRRSTIILVVFEHSFLRIFFCLLSEIIWILRRRLVILTNFLFFWSSLINPLKEPGSILCRYWQFKWSFLFLPMFLLCQENCFTQRLHERQNS